MIELETKIDKNIIQAAQEHKQLRDDCKKYLTKIGKNFDKFTIVSHDSFVGYITELAIKKYLQVRGENKNIKITSWSDNFEIARIKEIIKSNSTNEKDIEYVQNYFYDRYDLKLESPKKIVTIDIKTALTEKEPTERWNFMYPVVQATKPGKDYMILTYYVVGNGDPENLKKILLVGYISEEAISNCRIIKKGQKTRFGTISQIDNYETELSIHYQNIDDLIEIL